MKTILRYLLVSGLFFLIGFSYEYHLPKLKTWVLVKIEDLSTKHLPIRIFPQDLTATMWPPGLSFTNIRALPKGDLAKKLAPIKIASVSIRLRPQSLLSGDFRLSEIVISKPEVTLLANQETKKDSKQKQKIVLKDILAVPIQEVIIEDGLVQVRSDNAEMLTRAENLNVNLENRNDSVYVSIDAPNVFLKRSSLKSSMAQLSVNGAALISEDEISIRGIKIKETESFIIGSGSMSGKISDGNIKEIKFKSRSHIEIPSFLDTVSSFVKVNNLPDLDGSLDLEFQYQRDELGADTLAAIVSGKELEFKKIRAGAVTGDLLYQDNHIRAKELHIENDAGLIKLRNLDFNLNDSQQFSVIVGLSNVEIRQLLKQLNVGDTPLNITANAEVPCVGELKPEPSATCTGKLHGSQIRIWGKNPNKTIVALDNFAIDGTATVDSKNVTTKAKLFVGDSIGEASGTIAYDKGFDLKFSTDDLNFKNVKNLADLKIEGRAGITGSTSGNSDTAVFQFKLKGADSWFEDYGLGNITSDVSFASGNLYFKNIEGRFNTTRYFANISLDLNNDLIRADGKLGFAEARDIQIMFSHKVQLPFEFFGNASAKVSVHGPLEFTKLTYDLDTSVFRGSVGPEAFDEARFYITANKGEVRTQNVYLKKGLGVATMSGEGHPDGTINTEIKARNFRIEDLSLFNKNESLIQGSLNFDMTLKGPVLSPEAHIKGYASDTYISKEPLPNSKFELSLSRKSIDGQANFLDDRFTLDFALPLDLNAPFKFKAKTVKWNFSPLFGLIAKESVSKEFETELSTDINLESKTGGFWNASGKILMDSLKIRRGNLELYNPSQALILFDNGKMTIKNFLLQGDNTYLKAEAVNSTKNDFNVSVNGKVEMSLLAFFTPFLSDLRGILSIAGQLDGSAETPKLIGSAFIDRGYAKLKDLAHPFENIKADILFNQQKVLINSLQAQFAGGSAYTEGAIELKGFKHFPTNLKGRFEKVNLAVPKDFNTQGSGDFKITGEWFPFTLSGTYNIVSGTISKNYGDDQTLTEGVKRSTFLPEILLEKDFEPLRFDLQTNFPNNLFVKNNMIETEIRGAVKILGTTTDPVLIGEVTAPPGGRLMFRDVPFEINGASVKFNNTTKINPTLYAQASTRIKDYDVNLLLQGTKEKYQIILRSTPELAEQEIISLLALGYTSEQLEKVQSDQQIDQQTYEVGSAIISNNPFGNEIRNKYGVNVRFGSQVDDANNVAPKIIVSKQWTPRINTSASRTIGNSVTQDVKLEYQLNNSVSVIGSWEGKEYSEEQKATEADSKNLDIFGLDLQYKKEFK